MVVGGAACAVVLVDHRCTIAALGIDTRALARRLIALLVEAARGPSHVAQTEPAPQLARSRA
jgi:hypothetical protein